MKMHASITQDRIADAVRSEMFGMDNPGFCIYCGEDAEGVEPDAERYMCDVCDRPGVYGAEQLLLMTVA